MQLMACVWVSDKSRAVFAQCTMGRTSGSEYCQRHRQEERRPQGVWDPPHHSGMPVAKRKEGGQEAAKRARKRAVQAEEQVPDSAVHGGRGDCADMADVRPGHDESGDVKRRGRGRGRGRGG